MINCLFKLIDYSFLLIFYLVIVLIVINVFFKHTNVFVSFFLRTWNFIIMANKCISFCLPKDLEYTLCFYCFDLKDWDGKVPG